MAHRGGRNRGANTQQYGNRYCKQKGFDKYYWQSDAYNQRLFNYYFNLITQMALSRFKWVGLPKTCDPWFLERTLFFEGVATIAAPAKMPETFFSTKAVIASQPNVYDRPFKWRSYGNDGWSFHVTPKNGVLVWDNTTRMPLAEGVSLYANELVHIQLTKRMNRFHQQIPWILTGPQEKKMDMQNLTKQVSGGELAILATSGIEQVEVKTLNTNVPYIVDQLDEDERQTWDSIYMMLGFDNNPFKAERQTSDEIKAQQTPANAVRNSYLACRREACDDLNAYFGDYFPEPIRCEWNADNESDNFNLMHNAQQLAEAGN